MDNGIDLIIKDALEEASVELKKEMLKTIEMIKANQDAFIENQENIYEMYEENYRPTHKNKIHISNYIKKRLGDSYEVNESEDVKERILIMLGYDKWQDAPYKKLVSPAGMAVIDDSISSVMSFRTVSQPNLFDNMD